MPPRRSRTPRCSPSRTPLLRRRQRRNPVPFRPAENERGGRPPQKARDQPQWGLDRTNHKPHLARRRARSISVDRLSHTPPRRPVKLHAADQTKRRRQRSESRRPCRREQRCGTQRSRSCGRNERRAVAAATAQPQLRPRNAARYSLGSQDSSPMGHTSLPLTFCTYVVTTERSLQGLLELLEQAEWDIVVVLAHCWPAHMVPRLRDAMANVGKHSQVYSYERSRNEVFWMWRRERVSKGAHVMRMSHGNDLTLDCCRFNFNLKNDMWTAVACRSICIAACRDWQDDSTSQETRDTFWSRVAKEVVYYRVRIMTGVFKTQQHVLETMSQTAGARGGTVVCQPWKKSPQLRRKVDGDTCAYRNEPDIFVFPLYVFVFGTAPVRCND